MQIKCYRISCKHLLLVIYITLNGHGTAFGRKRSKALSLFLMGECTLSRGHHLLRQCLHCDKIGGIIIISTPARQWSSDWAIFYPWHKDICMAFLRKIDLVSRSALARRPGKYVCTWVELWNCYQFKPKVIVLHYLVSSSSCGDGCCHSQADDKKGGKCRGVWKSFVQLPALNPDLVSHFVMMRINNHMLL